MTPKEIKEKLWLNARRIDKKDVDLEMFDCMQILDYIAELENKLDVSLNNGVK